MAPLAAPTLALLALLLAAARPATAATVAFFSDAACATPTGLQQTAFADTCLLSTTFPLMLSSCSATSITFASFEPYGSVSTGGRCKKVTTLDQMNGATFPTACSVVPASLATKLGLSATTYTKVTNPACSSAGTNYLDVVVYSDASCTRALQSFTAAPAGTCLPNSYAGQYGTMLTVDTSVPPLRTFTVFRDSVCQAGSRFTSSPMVLNTCTPSTFLYGQATKVLLPYSPYAPAYMLTKAYSGTSCSGAPYQTSADLIGCVPFSSGGSYAVVCTSASSGVQNIYSSSDCDADTISSSYPMSFTTGCSINGGSASMTRSCMTGTPPAATGPGLVVVSFQSSSSCYGSPISTGVLCPRVPPGGPAHRNGVLPERLLVVWPGRVGHHHDER